jgi:hypothetical protein
MSEDFEQNLRRALRRESPGEDFAARVVSRLDADPAKDGASQGTRVPRIHATRFRMLRSRWLPAALAASIIAAVGVLQLRQHSLEAERADQARTQLLQALAIASQNVNIVRAAVAREEDPDT